MTPDPSGETQRFLGFASPEADRLPDAYEGLSPPGRLVAQAYGVVSPYDLGRGRVASILYRTRVAVRGRTFTQTEFMAAVKEVHEAGIVYRPGSNTGLSADPAWAPRLTIAAFEDGNLARIEEQFARESAGRSPRVPDAPDIMRLRCHVVAGRFDAIAHDLEEPEYRDWGWLAHPDAGQLMWRLPPPYVDEALAGWLDSAIETAAPADLAVKAWRECSRDPAQHAADIALIRILEGRPEDALAVFDALPAGARDGKPARTGRAATRALLAMLRGDDEEAARCITEAVAAEKAGTRKRNVFPPLRAFTLSLLALVRSDTPGNTAALERFLRIGAKQEAQPLFGEFVGDAAAVRRGEGAWVAPDGAAPFILRLFEGLLGCWVGGFDVFKEEERARALVEFAVRADTSGYRWLAAECFAVLDRIERLHARGGDAWQAITAREAELRADLGPETLVSLIEPAEDWEYPLREIEKVARGVQKGGTPRKRSSSGARRLVWILGTGHFGDITFQPRQQVAAKSGKWSKGRPVALKRLAEQAGEMDFLTKQDRTVAAGIRHSRNPWNAGPDHYLGMAGVYALAGHPHLFNQDGAQVDLIRREPELLVEEEEGRLRVRVAPHRERGDGDYRFARAGETRYEVTRFGAAHKEMMDVIPPEGIKLPVEARDRLVGAVSGLAGEFRVQGTMAAAGEARVTADSAPWVRLAPRGAGLAVDVVVEPAPGSAAYFTPGTGGTSVFAHRDGEAVRAERDLAAETAAARELVAACPMLAGLDPGYAMTVSGAAESLDLVEQLAAAEVRSLWPEGESFRIVARADTPSLRLSVKSAGDWFRASGRIDFDEERSYELRRIFEMMDRSPGSRFLELEDGAYVALTAAFRRTLEDLRVLAAPVRRGGTLRLHPMAAPVLEDLVEGAKLTADAGWRSRLQGWREALADEPETPGTLRGELRPYQVDGFRWLARLGDLGAGACLADDMGLGKTVQALAVLLRRAPDGPALVVVPTSVVANWLDEARRFAPTLNMATYDGPAASRARRLEGLDAFDLVVATYGVLQVDSEKLAAVDWGTVVLDEAQAIKNPATKRARAARGLKAGFRLVTTGTPIQNNVIDLFSLFSFLNPGMLGSLNRFRRHFAVPIERDGDADARARLRRLTAPFILRRLKSDVLDDLPPRTEITHHVELSPEEAALYEALRQRALEDLAAGAQDGTVAERARMQVLAHLMRLRLACCNPALVAPGHAPASSKMNAFAEILAELRRSGHKVLVFSQFVRHLRLIEDHLKQTGVPYQYLDGSTPAKSRAKRIADFQAGRGDAFLISTRAGGVGLNLTAADYVIHMDPWWNPSVEDQASDRAHRIGQTRPVTIYRLVAKGTIEEQIVDLHSRKRDLADRLLEGTDAPARLDADELVELLRQSI